MSEMRVIGIDLAWGEGSGQELANETGVVAVDPTGTIVAAGWTRGLDETADWIYQFAVPDTLPR